MPLEGHWKRINTPLRKTSRREGRLIVAVAAALALAVAVVLYVALQGDGSSAAKPGCIDVTAAHTVGGATLHACGSEAANWCRSSEVRSRRYTGLAQACRKAGYR